MAGRYSRYRSTKFILLLAGVCGCLTVLAPDPARAQLPAELQLPDNPSPGDTVLVRALIDSSYEYSYSDPDRSIRFAEQALRQSETLDFKEGIAGAHRELGYALSVKGDFRKALDHFKKGVAINRAMSDTLGILSHLSDIGSLYRKRSDYDRALEYFFQSLEL
ncbi:MAG: tetratricopeptide repeat protein [Balneolaceae bacterium]|nr:tetratricopeptide repeat protein [Balneolaceae bacterium]